MTHQEIREKFKNFMEARGHRWVASSSLLSDDPSVLFTTAGMQQFKPYYTGAADARHDFDSLNTASIQKCVRTSDIDSVGDASHLTFFEMLGNFSFGGYWKKEAITWAHEFITGEMGLQIDHISVFGGEGDIPADNESEAIWKSLDTDIVVRKAGRTDNFWGPTGDEGPCGPTTEIYVNGIEIWNVVFNEYYKKPGLPLESLAEKGIDTGMGLERLAMVSQGVATVFDTDLFAPIMRIIPDTVDQRTRRIAADHARAVAFMISDGITPSNKDQGYVLRRLLRRTIVHEHLWRDRALFEVSDILNAVVNEYKQFYHELDATRVQDAFTDELAKFSIAFRNGIKEFEKRWETGLFSGGDAYLLHESFGFPFMVTEDIIRKKKSNFDFDKLRDEYGEASRVHKAISRAGAEKKFGGHGLLLDTGELKAANGDELKKVTRLHTATHLLQAALRQVLGDKVSQAGSDITAERLRFDFTFPRKVTADEIAKVQNIVNDVVALDLPVTKQTLPQEEALKTGALHFFKIKYPPMVDVYSIGDPSGGGRSFSSEFCGGPHVTRTGEIGRVAIVKEETVSAGIRRIRATVD